MKLLFILIAMLLVGCASLQRHEDPFKEGIATAGAMARFADIASGGMSSPLVGGLGTLGGILFGANRWLLARKRGQAIKSIDDNPDTPKAVDQASERVHKVIVQVVGAK